MQVVDETYNKYDTRQKPEKERNVLWSSCQRQKK